MNNKPIIGVIGLGYVGLANALLLGQHNQVVAYDIDSKKTELLRKGISPIEDNYIQNYLKCKNTTIIYTDQFEEAVIKSDIILIATPTNYNEETNDFDTTTIEETISRARQLNKNAIFLIKSTIPIGYTEKVKQTFKYDKIIFSPEFLREGQALYDNLYPSRIVVGDKSDVGIKIATLFKNSAVKKDVEIVYTNPTEAEAIKLFANSYLAMRIAYFNELDTYAELFELETDKLIKGISLDPRIGDYYNNPSFGYGGYCLPKDSKQLKANFDGIPNRIIHAIVDSNSVRKKFIANQIINTGAKVVGIYKLVMKAGSDNFRQSAIQDIVSILKENNIEIIIYEPTLKERTFDGLKVIENFDDFEHQSERIVANRMDEQLSPFFNKVYTRDLFNRD